MPAKKCPSAAGVCALEGLKPAFLSPGRGDSGRLSVTQDVTGLPRGHPRGGGLVPLPRRLQPEARGPGREGRALRHKPASAPARALQKLSAAARNLCPLFARHVHSKLLATRVPPLPSALLPGGMQGPGAEIPEQGSSAGTEEEGRGRGDEEDGGGSRRNFSRGP